MAASPSEKQLAERLGTVPLFANTTNKQRRTIARLGKVLTWKEGSTAIRQGSKAAAFFLILDGMVDISRDGTKIARLGSDEFVGEMALLAKAPRNADVIAVSDTTVFAFGRPALNAALAAEPSIAMSMLEAMAARQTAL